METKIFTVDFDNTCAFEEFPTIGEDVPYAAEILSLLKKNGHKIVLWTCRTNRQLDYAVQWFKDHNIELDAINDYYFDERNLKLIKEYGTTRKVIGNWNIDDRNFGTPLKTFYSPKTTKSYICVDWLEIKKLLKEYNLISD